MGTLHRPLVVYFLFLYAVSAYTNMDEGSIVYANLYASAPSDATLLDVRPVAEITNQRNPPLISDVSQYQMAVMKVAIGGMRSLPVHIPAVELNQPDPTLLSTACTVTLTGQALTTVNWPLSVPFATYLDLRTYLPGGIQVNAWRVAAWGASPFADCTAYAAFLQSQIAGIPVLSGDPIAASIQVSCVQNHLVWSLSTTGSTYPPGSYYEVDCGSLASNPTFFNPNAPAQFGFAAIPPSSITLVDGAIPQGIYTLRSSAGAPAVSPNTPCYSFPAVLAIGTKTTNLVWVPQNTEARIAASPLYKQDVSSRYYWLQDYDWWCTIVNKALSTSFYAAAASVMSALDTNPLVGNFSDITASPPWFAYNAATQSFNLYVDPDVNVLGLPTEQLTPFQRPNNTVQGTQCARFLMSIGFNELLANLMLMPQTRFDGGGSQLTFTGPYQTTTTDSPQGVTKAWKVYSSNIVTTSNGWSPWSSVVLTSSTIPLQQESVPPTTVFGGSSIGAGFAGSTNSGTTQMLQDFTPENSAADWNATLTGYIPSVIRWCTMVGAGPLAYLQLKVSLRYALSGVLWDLELDPGAYVDVKLAFRPIQRSYA